MNRLNKLELQLVGLQDKQSALIQKGNTLTFTNGVDKKADAEFKRIDLEINRVTAKIHNTLFSIMAEKRKLALKEREMGIWNGK